MYIVHGESGVAVSDLESEGQSSSEIIQNLQVSTYGLFGGEVVDERPRYAETTFFWGPAAAACAIGLDPAEIFSERGMLEIEDAICGDGIPKTLNNCKHAEVN